MSDERWQRVGALFARALAAPQPGREAVVRGSSEPRDIQDEVLALLRSHDSSDRFLEPPALLPPGAEVGAYRIERVLGRGGMGVVYLAQDTRLHRKVALKSLPPQLFHDTGMRDRLRKEARAAAALSHPSIATIYALEEIGDQLYIAAEYVEGRTLRSELDAGAMQPLHAVAVALEIAKAMSAAHERGIVHRDLKPENVMLLGQAQIKIVDFGLAQFDVAANDLASATMATDSGRIAGTPAYMAPEHLLGKKTDARSDQFAFGVMLYEMLTGHRELDREGVDDHLWSIIERATQKNPDKRFATMRDLATALGSPRVATSGTPGTRLSPGSRDTRHLWWARHQLIVALAYWFMVWPAWHVHKWTGSYGVYVFLATLTVVVLGGNTRLHLWFTSLTYPSELAKQRADVARLVRGADIGFALMMMAIGLTIAGEHTGWGALFVSFGLGAAVAFLVIEPATARAAFRTP